MRATGPFGDMACPSLEVSWFWLSPGASAGLGGLWHGFEGHAQPWLRWPRPWNLLRWVLGGQGQRWRQSGLSQGHGRWFCGKDTGWCRSSGRNWILLQGSRRLLESDEVAVALSLQVNDAATLLLPSIQPLALLLLAQILSAWLVLFHGLLGFRSRFQQCEVIHKRLSAHGTLHSHLFEGRGRAVLQLRFLRLQLLLHVLDVTCQTMAVEVVVAGCLGEGLLLLESIEADNTLAVGYVVISENLLPFLDEFIEHGSAQAFSGHVAQCLGDLVDLLI